MSEIEAHQRRGRTAALGSGVTLLAIGLMAWDHLWGNEGGQADPFPVDPVTFFVSLALIAVTAAVVFGFTVPRAARRPGSVHRASLIHSGIALVLAIPLSWLGFPAIAAGAGIALGAQGAGGSHRRTSIVAIAVGVVVILFAILGTAFPPTDDS
jgi:hypothetical protein